MKPSLEIKVATKLSQTCEVYEIDLNEIHISGMYQHVAL